ncbi:MAG TPA: methyltransferase domain-containing protein [Planctomycetota bacterium]|nr:methyltransferase domain-containing protein [Planctomycetota bacterium]
MGEGGIGNRGTQAGEGPPGSGTWDPAQYARFADERSRPFFDLLARVPGRPYARIADLGCGRGDLTRVLADRWPTARVTGVDASAEMLASAKPEPGRLDFVQADLAAWAPAEPFDLVFSNAALHWLPDHGHLLPRLAGRLSTPGVLAFQVPGNQQAPSHAVTIGLSREPHWRARLGDWAPPAVLPLASYVEGLSALGFRVDAWETTYLHRLPGENPVLEWMQGTTLRPLLARLGADAPAFLAELAPRLRAAYPPGPAGTLYPFRRLFVVASRR